MCVHPPVSFNSIFTILEGISILFWAVFLFLFLLCFTLVVVAICEGSKTVLSCTTGRINICSALYGRTEADVCPRENMDSNINCMATGVFDTISCCTGLSQCDVTASDSVFGDPCPDTYKYLQITYTCEPENELPPQTLSKYIISLNTL